MEFRDYDFKSWKVSIGDDHYGYMENRENNYRITTTDDLLETVQRDGVTIYDWPPHIFIKGWSHIDDFIWAFTCLCRLTDHKIDQSIWENTMSHCVKIITDRLEFFKDHKWGY